MSSWVPGVADGTTVLSASFSPDIFTLRTNGTGRRPVTRTAVWESAPDTGTTCGERPRPDEDTGAAAVKVAHD
jgi:hypothetical protein